MSQKSIESMKKEQRKWADKVSSINAQLEALMQEKADSIKEQKRVDKEIKKAERVSVSVERRKNRNVRTRNLIKLAGDVLNLFPDLKKQFEESVTKEDYNRNGEIARREIVAFISSKKGLPIPAQESEKFIDSTPPAHGEDITSVPSQEKPQSLRPGTETETAPTPSKSPTFDFSTYNKSYRDVRPVEGKVCPCCGAQIFAAKDKDGILYFFCGNSHYWKQGNQNCSFYSRDIHELKDIPESEK